VVGGIARTIRGVADGYVHEKLDEIEARIDRKLDEIDRRLGEWRDREIVNRLKIIKITLIASVFVFLLSLGYNYLKRKPPPEKGPPPPAEPSSHADRMDPCEVSEPWL
jgi:tetrahydromethanopterin S-methyltransferase subunit G